VKRKGKKPVPRLHIDKRECWCQPVWVSGRATIGALLHRRHPGEPAHLRLEQVNDTAGAR